MWNEQVGETEKQFLDAATDLSEEERESIRGLAESIQMKEKAQSWRVLFQRAPESTLPFIIYCVYIGVWGGMTLFQLSQYSGQKLIILGLLLAAVMILPLFVLPLNSWKNLWAWLKAKG